MTSVWRTFTTAQPLGPVDERARQSALTLLRAGADCLWRDGAQGHVTASCFIVGPDGKVLLTHHPKYNQWQQLGGHLEPGDVSLSAAAHREALEESGIAALTLVATPAQFTTIAVQCPQSGSFHFDVRYTFLADTSDYVVSDESNDLGWFDADELPTDEPELAVGARRAVAHAAALRAPGR